VKKYFAILLLLLLSSCVVQRYQMFDLAPTKPETRMDNKAVFNRDGNLEIQLNFWQEGGYSKILLYNLTDSIMYVDMPRSHIIVDHAAIPLFSIYGLTESHFSAYLSGYTYRSSGYINGVSTGTVSTTPAYLILPPHTYKEVSGVSLVNAPLLYSWTRAFNRAYSDSLAVIHPTPPFNSLSYRIYYSLQENGPKKELDIDLALSRMCVMSLSEFNSILVQNPHNSLSRKDYPFYNNGYPNKNYIPYYCKPNRFYISDWRNKADTDGSNYLN
jgi:hypothetical protein